MLCSVQKAMECPQFLATYITLSYIKILNVSFELLLPSCIYNEEGQHVNVALLYYNGYDFKSILTILNTCSHHAANIQHTSPSVAHCLSI